MPEILQLRNNSGIQPSVWGGLNEPQTSVVLREELYMAQIQNLHNLKTVKNGTTFWIFT